MIQEHLQDQHNQQKIFLYLHNTDNGQKLKHLNQLDDESCWSDSQKQYQQKEEEQSYFQEPVNSQSQEIDQQSINGLEKKIKQLKLNEISQKQLLFCGEESSRVSCNKTIKTNMASQRFSNYFEPNNLDSFYHSKVDNTNKDTFSVIKSNKLLMLRMSNKIESDSSKIHTDKDTAGNVRNRSTIQHDNYKIVQSKQKLFFYKLRSKMIFFFKNFTLIGRTQQLNKKIRRQISDLSDYIAKDKSNSFFEIMKSLCFFKIKWKQVPIINPESYVGFAIKIFFTLFNCFFLFFFSLLIIFQGRDYSQGKSQIIVSIVWVLEVILKLNTSTFDQFKVVSKRQQIMISYLKQQAFFDIIPSIVITIPHFELFSQSILSVLAFIKIKNIISDLSDIQRQLCMMVKRYYLVQLLNLILKLFLIGHIISCLWYLLALIELHYLDEQQTWFVDSVGIDGSWWKLYISALYWSLTLMTTGSNTATTALQTFFTSFIMLFTTISFGYFLNTIGVILSEMDENDENRRRDINIINEYMRSKNISKILKSRVNLNLEHYYQQNFKKISEDRTQVLEKISIELQHQLLKEYNRQILNKIEVLKKKFSSSTLDDLSLAVSEEYYFPNQIIVDQNDHQNTSMMYIIQGEVEHIYQNKVNLNQNNRNIIKSGQVFGQIEFFTGMNNEGCTKSKEFTKIIKIDRQKFIDIIKEKEKDYQIFCQIKDNILLYNSFFQSQTQCPICKSYNHQVQDCLLIHLNKQYSLTKISYSSSLKQDRQYCDRKIQKKTKTSTNVNKIQQATLMYLESGKLTGLFGSNNDMSSSNSQDESNNYNMSERFSDLQQSEQKYSKSNFSRHEFEKSLSQNEEKSKKYQKAKSDIEEYIQSFDNQKTSFKEILDYNLLSSSKLNSDVKASKKENIVESSKNIKRDFMDFEPKSHAEYTDKKLNSFSNIEQCKMNDDNEESSKNIKLQKSKESSFKIQLKYPKEKPNFQKQNSKTNYLNMNTTLQEYHDFLTRKYQSVIYTNNIIDEDQQLTAYQYNPWYFEQLKDYKYYFPHGNSYNVLKKVTRNRRRTTRIFHKKFKTRV